MPGVLPGLDAIGNFMDYSRDVFYGDAESEDMQSAGVV